MAVRIGAPAPSFDADAYVPGAPGPKRSTLERYRGSWVVLVFYARDFAYVCRSELQGFGELESGFAEERAILVAASTDSYWSHKAWLETHPLLGDITFPVIADTTRALALDYGVLGEDGSAPRATFIIDPEGRAARDDQRPERGPKPRGDPPRAPGAQDRAALSRRLAQGPANVRSGLEAGLRQNGAELGPEPCQLRMTLVREVVDSGCPMSTSRSQANGQPSPLPVASSPPRPRTASASPSLRLGLRRRRTDPKLLFRCVPPCACGATEHPGSSTSAASLEGRPCVGAAPSAEQRARRAHGPAAGGIEPRRPSCQADGEIRRRHAPGHVPIRLGRRRPQDLPSSTSALTSYARGGTLWRKWNTLPGSYRCFTLTSRAKFEP